MKTEKLRTRNSGITLMSLVITIIVILILVGVTIATLTGDNGLITKAIKAKEKAEIAELRERISLIKLDWEIDKTIDPTVTIDDFWEKLIKEGIISGEEDVTGPEKDGDNEIYTLKTEGGYLVEVIVYSTTANIQIGDIMKANGLLNNITEENTSSNSISVKVLTKGKPKNLTLSYFYKSASENIYHELAEKQNTSDLEATFTNLTQGTVYIIKVIATSGDETSELVRKMSTKTVDGVSEGLTEGNIVASIASWDATTHTANVILETTTNYQIQWQINSSDENSWNTAEQGTDAVITDLELNNKIYARLYDGQNAGDYATTTVRDEEDPEEAQIEINNYTASQGGKIKATVKLKDNQSGVCLTDCRWVYTNNADKLGVTSSQFTGTFSSENGEIEWTSPSDLQLDTSYWLHVLTVDKAGNQIETVTTTPVTVLGVDTFSTEYGLVDIVWLSGTGNTITSSPNLPTLPSGMTKVTWTKNGDTWTEDATANTSEWGKYNAGSGTADNLNSKWANAKRTADGSYFVWIPRYAYRIKYYSDENYTNLTGYYDGKGMWRAFDGKLRVALDAGVETVTASNGDKYIVHPAFNNNVDLGGWSSKIRGFWTAKYEISREDSKNGSTWTPHGNSTDEGGGNTLITSSNNDKIRAVSKPNVPSWRYLTIGNAYTNAYNYDRSKESHLIKNSEWGAIAYLTQSKYGRNGHEIDVNGSAKYYTGNGSGEVSSGTFFTSSIQNRYDTETGAKASTTGNIYGVYDMSGGAEEWIAAWDVGGAENYLSTRGSSFAVSATTTSEVSTKYATAYRNGTRSGSGNQIKYEVGKIGDATKEVNKGGKKPVNSSEGFVNWFMDGSSMVYYNYPFFQRSGIRSSAKWG